MTRPDEGVYIYEFKGTEASILHESLVDGEEGESETKMNAILLPTDPRSDDGKESGM